MNKGGNKRGGSASRVPVPDLISGKALTELYFFIFIF